MKREIIEDKLFVYFPDKVETANAQEIEKELFEYMEENPDLTVVIDVKDTNYIASSGLRVLLKAKKSGRDLYVVKASPELYDIFEMTGFTNIINVVKKRRTISLEGAKLIGEGYSSKVYRIAEDIIVKVFIRDTSIEDIYRELNLAKKAFVLGIPTAISYDVVEVEGRYGVIFEQINCGLLRDAILEEPDQFDNYMKNYADLLLTLNTTDVGDTEMPDIKVRYLEISELLKGKVTEEEYREIKDFIASIPDSHTFVHGDCHIKNIMYSGSELLLIDMDTLSYGNPLFELALLYGPYMIFPKIYENNSMEFFGITEEMSEEIQIKVFDQYFESENSPLKKEQMPQVIRLAHIHLMLFMALYEPDDEKSFQKAYSLYREAVAGIARE